MKIAVLFDGASALATSPDLLILETVEAIEGALAGEGNQVVRVPVHPDGRWIERLRRGKFDLAFNMCEGIDGVAALESSVIAVLELFDIPYTGSSSYTTALCLRKHVVNTLLERSGLPVPPWMLVANAGRLGSVGFPAICKPAAEDASIGVEQRSVVKSARALVARVDAMLERWDDVLVQRYIEGREVNVGVIGATVLPIAEIDFGAMPRGMWPIITYRSKWDTGSDEDLGAVPRCPARLPARVAREVQQIALAAWRAVGGAGYGRVDMRIDADGRPWILEVNANPDIAPDAGLARMAQTVGIDYSALIRMIAELALERRHVDALPTARWAVAERLSGVVERGQEPDLFAVGE